MNAPVNIYAAIVFDLPPKVKEFIEVLDKDGQIDRDEHQQPYLLKVDKKGSNYHCFIVRNGVVQNFILNTRKRKEPVITWNRNDGFKRQDAAQAKVVQAPLTGPRGERAKRTFETWDRLVEQILRNL